MGRTTPSPRLMSTATVTAILAILASTCIARNVLMSGEELNTGQYLYVGQYRFIMQDDCNLVLYENSNALWASNTARGQVVACKALLWKVGLLAVSYIFPEYTAWWSGSYPLNIGNYVLVLREDGNVIIYGTDIWSTNTAKISAGGAVVMPMNDTVDGGSAIGPATVNQNASAIPNTWRTVLMSGEELSADQSLNTIAFKFILQGNCNLVLYEYSTIIWSTNTAVPIVIDCKAVMQDDGNFVIYNGISAIWASNTQREKGNYVLVLQEDRNIAIYGPDVWSTGTSIKSAGRSVVTAMNSTVDGGSMIGSVTVDQKYATAIPKVGTDAA